MQMDGSSLHCGYPDYHHHQAGQVNNTHTSVGPMLTPPSTPTNDLASLAGPDYSSCEDQYDVMHHRYAHTDYHTSHYSTDESQDHHHNHHRLHGGGPTGGLSLPDSPQVTPMISPDHSPMHHHLSTAGLRSMDMHPDPEDSCSYTPTSSASSSRKSSNSSNKSSRSTSRNRKSSYVYDVRLTDEQFLFLVPDLDLVKSHLMFAVREEVEVLKEKITELMERINQLEYENTVLKQYATNEALQQIQQHHNSNT